MLGRRLDEKKAWKIAGSNWMLGSDCHWGKQMESCFCLTRLAWKPPALCWYTQKVEVTSSFHCSPSAVQRNVFDPHASLGTWHMHLFLLIAMMENWHPIWNIMTFKSMIKLFFLRYYELWTSIQSTIRLQVGRFKMFDVHSYLRVWVPLGLTFFSQGDTVATTHQHPPTRNIGLVNLIIHGRSISLESSWVIPFKDDLLGFFLR